MEDDPYICPHCGYIYAESEQFLHIYHKKIEWYYCVNCGEKLPVTDEDD